MPSVILDACVLYPATLRDFLLRLVEAEVFDGYMTHEILDECFRSILRDRPDLNPHKLRRTRDALEGAFADLIIDGYEHLIGDVDLPDQNDRHVLAAAIHEGISLIVTFNLRDFPESALSPQGIVALHPDTFVLACLEMADEMIVDVLRAQAAELRNPPTTVDQMLDRLAIQGLTKAVAVMRWHIQR